MKKSLAALLPMAAALSALVAGCAVEAPAQRVYVAPLPVAYAPAPPAAVVSVYIDPPLYQPEPIAVSWAPPPMLVEVPTPLPFGGAVWIGGYWAWHGNWVWAAGRWAPPPQPNYLWVQPYYEHRDAAVIFIGGHWAAPGVVFVPPPPNFRISFAVALPGVVAGPPPMGPPGIFVPPPPGSRPGIIVPAPLGTPPAVVVSAPPVNNVGMRVQNNINNTRITNTTNVTNITNVTNLTVVAPAGATANGRAFEASVPAQAHLAAALPSVVHAMAPAPQSSRPIPAYRAGDAPTPLPQAQAVRAFAPPRAAPMAEPAAAPAPMRPAEAVAPLAPVARPTAPSEAPRAAPPSPPPPQAAKPRPGDDARIARQRQQADAKAARAQQAAAAKAAHPKPAPKDPTHAEVREGERREKGER